MTTIIISPTTVLSGEEATVFFKFLEAQKDIARAYFPQGYVTPYKEYLIMFGENMLCQNLNQNTYNCNFIGHEIGSGTFGVVYDIKTIIRVTNLQYKPTEYQPQALKIQGNCQCSTPLTTCYCSPGYAETLIKNEHRLTSRTPHIAIQEPIFDQHTRKSYLLMTKFPGEELHKILVKDRLSPQQRIDLTLVLLTALKTQVTGCKLVHRDLKPENIMVDLRSKKPIINIIDYAFASPSGVMDDTNCGTLNYIPPEALTNRSTAYLQEPSRDIFALGKILAWLWGGYNRSYEINYTIFNYHRDIQNAEFWTLPDLFKQLPLETHTMLQTHLANIKHLLTQMIAPFPEDRPTIDEALLEFQAIHRAFNPQDLYERQRFFLPIEPEQRSDNMRDLNTQHCCNIL